MGAVYEALHTGLNKRFALKVMVSEHTRDPQLVQRFLREGEAAARVRHPHIVDVSDVGTRDGVAYLVMEYLDGRSLAEELAAEGPMPVRALVSVLLPVCAALAAAHDAGVVHRDLKPENIFLARGPRGERLPKLVDFGISRIGALDDPQAQRLTGSAVILGTPCYMAPEQTQGARFVDALSDQYALGVVMYECTTGHLPFLGETLFGTLRAILSDTPRPPTEHVPGLDPTFARLILRAMSRDRLDRFPDLRALGHSLLRFASPTEVALWSPDFPEPAALAETLRPPRPADAMDPPPPPVAPEAAPLRASTDAPVDAPSAPSRRPARLPTLLLVATVAVTATVVLLKGRDAPALRTPPAPAPLAAPVAAPAPIATPALPSTPIAAAAPAPAPPSAPIAAPAPAPPSAPAAVPRQRTPHRSATPPRAPVPSTPAPSTPAPSTPAPSTPAPSTPAPSTPALTAPRNPWQIRTTF